MALRTLDIADGFSSASTPSDAVVVAKIKDATGAAFSNSNRLPVDIGTVSLTVSNEVEIKNDSGSPVPVNGSVTANLGTLNGAATAANQVSGGPQTGSGVVTATTQRVTLATDGPEVTNSTATKNSVASMDSKTPALGQALAAASSPVVLTALQVTALTPPAAITGFNLETTQSAMSAKLPATLGQKVMASSMAVTIASDQTTLPVTSGSTTGTITCIQQTVGLTAVRATVSGSAPTSIRKKLSIKPSKNNTGAIYFGSSAVTISTGMEIIGPDRVELLADYADYYLISDTAGQKVEILEIN